jgi:hypothetical protein
LFRRTQLVNKQNLPVGPSLSTLLSTFSMKDGRPEQGAGLGIGALVVLVTLWYALPLMLRGNSSSAKQLMAQAQG